MCDGFAKRAISTNVGWLARGVRRIDDAAAHVARDDLEPPILIGIDQPKVRHRRAGQPWRCCNHAPLEGYGSIRGRPVGRQGQLSWRGSFVVVEG